MSVELIGWHDEDSPDHRRRLRNAMLVSVALHGSIFAAFAVTPSRPVAPMPQVLAVELVAGPAAATPAARPRSAPPAKAPAPSPPAKAPEPPPPAPAPPVAKAPVQVLPEEAPGRILEAKPEPAEPKKVAKVEPKPPPRPRREKEEELSYDAAMAELGLDETEEFLEALPAPRKAEEPGGEPSQATPAETSTAGAAISPELAAWNLATRRRIQDKWVTPPSFRGRGLATRLELQLSASGKLIGTPRVVASSGDPFFDDNAVRAVLTVAPLPPPPEPGPRSFLFRSEAN